MPKNQNLSKNLTKSKNLANSTKAKNSATNLSKNEANLIKATNSKSKITGKRSPIVSALMPVFNTNLEYLKTNLESILTQSFEDFELLILNDSPQNLKLEAFILDYAKKDKRIKYFKNPRNLGISPSRNKLIDLAKGEFLAVIDHDDLSEKTRFEKQVKFLRDNESVGVVSARYKLAQNDEQMQLKQGLVISDILKDDEIKINLMLHNGDLSHSGSMLRKRVLDESNVRYNALYTPCEDYKLFCDLIKWTEFAILDEFLIYRRHYDNTSAKLKQKMEERKWAIVSENRLKYPELFRIATIKSRADLIGQSRKIRRIRILGIPFFKIIKNDIDFKIKLFSKITIFRMRDSF